MKSCSAGASASTPESLSLASRMMPWYCARRAWASLVRVGAFAQRAGRGGVVACRSEVTLHGGEFVGEVLA